MDNNPFRLPEAKDRFRIPRLWLIMNLPGSPPAMGVGVCRSPFRADKNASFSIFDEGRRWKDHATGEGGTAVDFLMKAEGLDATTAVKRLLDLDAGARPARRKSSSLNFPRSDYPDVSFLKTPSEAEVCLIAKLRRVNAAAISDLAACGILKCGLFDGVRVWGILDGPPGQPPRVAEIRRLDGARMRVRGSTEFVKGKTLWRSQKDWPVGVSRLSERAWNAVLLCEGMPDILAAAHFSFLAGRFDLCPVTILGRSTRSIHPAAVELLSNRRIRIFPHADPDGGGVGAAKRWAMMLPGTMVDRFDFSGLRRVDGKQVNDLNDCALIHPADASALGELLP